MPTTAGNGGAASGARVQEEGRDGLVKEERRDTFIKEEMRDHSIKEERRPDPDLASAFASLPLDLRDGRYSTDSRSSSVGVKQEYASSSRAAKDEQREWRGEKNDSGLSSTAEDGLSGSHRGSAFRSPQDLGNHRCMYIPPLSCGHADALRSDSVFTPASSSRSLSKSA